MTKSIDESTRTRAGSKVFAPLFFFLLVAVPVTNLSAATFHALIVGETSDQGLESSVHSDVNLARRFAERVGDHFDSKSIHYFVGMKASAAKLRQAISDLSLESDDFVFFYYSGHGTRSRAGAHWPQLALVDELVEGRDLLKDLQRKSSLRNLVVFDACNSDASLPPARAPASASFNALQIDRLFKNIKGSVIITSSEPGTDSYADSNGGPSQFSREFFQVMSDTLPANTENSWRSLLDLVKERVELNEKYEKQIPKYDLTSTID